MSEPRVGSIALGECRLMSSVFREEAAADFARAMARIDDIFRFLAGRGFMSCCSRRSNMGGGIEQTQRRTRREIIGGVTIARRLRTLSSSSAGH
jgi:hypothetical protein